MIHASWINKCMDNENIKFDESNLIYNNDYVSQYEKKKLGEIDGREVNPFIVRDGLFSILWQQFTEKKISNNSVLSLQSASFLESDPKQLFYRFEKVKPMNSHVENTLILFYMDHKTLPLSIIENSLKNVEKSLVLNKKSKIYCHITTSHKKEPESRFSRSHMFSFFKMLTKHLGNDTQYLETADLLKVGDMSGWQVFTAGAEWIVSDNYLLHLCLSKNAELLSSFPGPDFKKIIKSYELSPHHKLSIGEIGSQSNSETITKLKLLKKLNLNENERENILKIPNEFLELVSGALKL